jgi:hypothetical protein
VPATADAGHATVGMRQAPAGRHVAVFGSCCASPGSSRSGIAPSRSPAAALKCVSSRILLGPSTGNATKRRRLRPATENALQFQAGPRSRPQQPVGCGQQSFVVAFAVVGSKRVHSRQEGRNVGVDATPDLRQWRVRREAAGAWITAVFGALASRGPTALGRRRKRSSPSPPLAIHPCFATLCCDLLDDVSNSRRGAAVAAGYVRQPFALPKARSDFRPFAARYLTPDSRVGQSP